MKNILIKISTVVVLTASVISCAGRLEITPPNSITDEQINDILNNGTDAKKQGVVTGFIAPMVKYFNLQDSNNDCSTGSANAINYGLPCIEWARGLMGNDIVMGFDTEPYGLAGGALYKYEIDFRTKVGNTNYCHWALYAIAINQANNVLSYMTEQRAAENNLYKDGRARALIVRAYSYMCMMEEYQDAYLLGGKDKLGLSLYTKYDPLQETVARSTSQETWAFIMKDLTDARTYLTDAGITYTVGRDNSEDLDLGVVNFLIARGALLTGDWPTCKTACKNIIDSGAYSFISADNYGGNSASWTPSSSISIDPTTNAFTCLTKNPEAILGFKVGSAYYQYVATFFNLANSFATYSQLKSTPRIDKRLYQQISDNDVRKDAFHADEVGSYSFSNGNAGFLPSYMNLKFAATDGLANGGTKLGKPKENTTLDYTKFRLSEVYLMYAEACCNSSDESTAKTLINTLLEARAKSGTTLTVDADYSGSSMLDVVKLQWRIEMWGEGGREWYNNKRWGVNIDRTGANSTHTYQVTWPANKMTLHIPERELQDNNLCVDNQIVD